MRQLEYIVAVADTGRVSAAAELLNVSQPSLSAQLSEVETDLGVELFKRGRSGAKITPMGQEIARRARFILNELHDLRAAARGSGIFQGHLRLGTLPSVGPYLLPGVVRRLHEEHPSFRLIVREENTRNLDEGLRSGRLDMIISTPEDHPGAHQTTLFDENLWVALARDHPLAGQSDPISIADLRDETFLTLGGKHRLAHIVSGLARSAGGRVSEEYEGTSLDAIRLMAASGAGIALLPSIYALIEARRGTDVILREIKDPDARRDIALISMHHRKTRADSNILAEILTREAAQILG